MLEKVRMERNNTQMIIDLDSTHSDTLGNQEKTEYNTHYGTQGYHPLVAFDGLTGDFLKTELRSDNVYVKRCKRFSDTDARTLPSSLSLHRYFCPGRQQLCDARGL